MFAKRSIFLPLLAACLGSCAAGSIRPPPLPRGALRLETSGEDVPRANHIRLLRGVRSLSNDSFWGTVDDQDLVGVDYARAGRGWGFELGASHSADNLIFVLIPELAEGSVDEFWVGVHYRNRLGESPFVFEAGAGPSLVLGALDVEVPGTSTVVHAHGTTAGLYVHGGLDLMLGDGFSLGLDLRLLKTAGLDLEFGSTKLREGDADSVSASLYWGVHF